MTDGGQRIVVGVDGSNESAAALAWAADHARRAGGRLQVIMCWEYPTAFGYAPDFGGVDLETDARHRLEELLARVLDDQPTVPVEPRVVEGHAAPVLVEAARSADLLVVGSRGHGALAGMLLGSTSQHCVNHAACPVVVVRPPAAGGQA
jgi:nucleotide-binding universal stress UspA family protein